LFSFFQPKDALPANLLHRRFPTGAIEAHVFRAGTANLGQPFRRSFASSVQANARIIRGCAFRVCVLGDGLSIQVHRLQGPSVFGLERLENTRQALADVRLYLGLITYRSLRCELLVRAVTRCTSAVVVDRRVTQNGIEPRDHAFIFLKLRSFLDQLEVARLQYVFSRRRTDFCLQKAEKGAPLFKQLRSQPSFAFGCSSFRLANFPLTSMRRIR
jgi:hypothetical protein